MFNIYHDSTIQFLTLRPMGLAKKKPEMESLYLSGTICELKKGTPWLPHVFSIDDSPIKTSISSGSSG